MTADLLLSGQTIPSGSTVCPHLFLFNPSQDSFDMEWEIDFSQPILGFATTQAELEQTDFLSAAGVVFNPNREIENSDSVRSIAGPNHNRKLKLDLTTRAGKSDSVRIFIACES